MLWQWAEENGHLSLSRTKPQGQGVSKISVTYSKGCLRFLDILTLWNHITRFEICKKRYIFLKQVKGTLHHSWNFHAKKNRFIVIIFMSRDSSSHRSDWPRFFSRSEMKLFSPPRPYQSVVYSAYALVTGILLRSYGQSMKFNISPTSHAKVKKS